MEKKTDAERVPGSFRDPSGFLYVEDGWIYRQVNLSYKEDYDLLMGSGLYEALTRDGRLIPHDEEADTRTEQAQAYKVIRPKIVPFVSYPYEWSFSRLKDAALATLNIQKTALDYGMSLKDASAYNIQFLDGRPVLVDTLSFERYVEGRPWIAYRQFCQHFLAPLALISYRDARLSQLLKSHIDGIPLDLVAKLLPLGTRFLPSLLMHIHLHARSQTYFADRKVDPKKVRMSSYQLRALLDNLENAVKRLSWYPETRHWAEYYDHTNYGEGGLEHKKQLVAEMLDGVRPRTIWDLGANTGLFSRIACRTGAFTVSIDGDPAAVEANYLECKRNAEKNLLPLVIDLTNPSPSLGWGNEERESLVKRGPVDLVMALALVHHLAISNNVPFAKISSLFARLTEHVIIEFVPKEDSQVQRLLATRADVFPEYTREAFEAEFGNRFEIVSCCPIQDSKRTLYLLKRHSHQN